MSRYHCNSISRPGLWKIIQVWSHWKITCKGEETNLLKKKPYLLLLRIYLSQYFLLATNWDNACRFRGRKWWCLALFCRYIGRFGSWASRLPNQGNQSCCVHYFLLIVVLMWMQYNTIWSNFPGKFGWSGGCYDCRSFWRHKTREVIM